MDLVLLPIHKFECLTRYYYQLQEITMYDILFEANGINFVSNFAKNLSNLSKIGCRREDAVTEIGRGKGKSKGIVKITVE